MTVRIKNWHKFQHFKDRRPPWVKLYRDLLDDMDWHQLDPVAAKTLVMLWLIASENDGALPDAKTLAFRLRTTERAMSESLKSLSHWLEQSDITPISERHQGDAPETEGETEKEKRQKPVRKCPESFAVNPEMKAWAAKEAPGVDVDRETEKMRDHTFAQPRTDWTATWRNWIRESYDRLRNKPGAIVTVPGPKGRDPALLKIEQDAKRAVPPSLETLQKMAELRKVA